MAITYDPIATTTLGSAAANITFSSISSAYTDLVLIVSAQCTAAATDKDMWLRLNSDTGTNYSRTRLVGNGSTATSSRESNVAQIICGAMSGSTYSSEFDTFIIQLNNYSNTTTNKTVLVRNGHAQIATQAIVGLWRSTSAISTITILPETSNFATGTTATLYGIKAA